MAKKGDREDINLKCPEGHYIRPTSRNKKNSGKLSVNKYCPTCNKRQKFTEAK